VIAAGLLLTLHAIEQVPKAYGGLKGYATMAWFEAHCAHEGDEERYFRRATGLREALVAPFGEPRLDQIDARSAEVDPGRCSKGEISRAYRDGFERNARGIEDWLNRHTAEGG